MKTSTLNLLLLAACCMIGGNATAKAPSPGTASSDNKIKKIDRMPTFMGGDPDDTFCQWIVNKMDSLALGVGSARFTFVIDRQGYVSYVSRVRCSDTVIRDHVEDLLLASPRWSPAVIGQDSVCLGYIINYDAKRLMTDCDLIYVVNSKSIPHDPDNPPVRIEQSGPKFDGGPMNNIAHVLAGRVKYPAALKSRGIEGTVYTLVTIEPDGKVTTMIVRSPAAEMSKEVERAIRSLSSHMTPGTINYEPVKTGCTIPFQFQIR